MTRSLNVRAALFAAMAASLLTTPAQAFVIDPNPGGVSFFIDKPANGSTTFCGVVGVNRACTAATDDLEVNVLSDVGVQTGNGYANIKPDDNETLIRSLTFTPENPNEFGDFSLRGQLFAAATQTNPLVVTVTDNQGHPSESFNFFPIASTSDFTRLGIVSTTQTIKQVVVLFASGFNEVKQIDFSFAAGVVPPGEVPEPGTLALLGLALAGIGFARRRS